MSQDTQTKEKKKASGIKVFFIVLLVIAMIIAIGIGVISFMVRPVDDKSDKAVPVGGMLTSQSIEYKDESSKGLENNLSLKIMQIALKRWHFYS